MHVVIGLLVAIALFAAERGIDSSVFQQVISFQALDIFVLICLAFVPLLLVLAMVVRRPRMMVRRMATYAVVLALVGIGFMAFKVLYSPTNSTASIAAIAAVAATIGWILQRQAAFDLSRKQHTLNILLQLRQSDIFNRHRVNVFSTFPDAQIITPAEAATIYAQRLDGSAYALDPATGQIKFPMVESARYICNYYEFLSAAVYHGDIDDVLLKSSMDNIMKSTFSKFEHFMTNVMTKKQERASNYGVSLFLFLVAYKKALEIGVSCCRQPAQDLPSG